MSLLSPPRRPLLMPAWSRNDLWRRAAAVPSLDLNFAAAKALGPLVTFTRASTGTYVGSNGVLQTATTNLLLRSEEFDNAIWTKANITATSNQTTAPDGSANADLIAGNTGTALKYIYQSYSAATSGAFTFSVFAKAGTESFIVVRVTDQGGVNEVRQQFNLSSGAVSGSVVVNGTATTASSSINPVGNGWYQCVVTATFAAFTQLQGNVWLNSYAAVSLTTNFYLWGAQLEQSSTVGEYIPTTSTINSAPRFDHNPTTGESLGLLVEESRTNSIRNNTMLGAGAGTPGTLPTNWIGPALSGLTREVVGTGTESGIAYVDVRYFGTTTSALFQNVSFEVTNQIAAAQSSIWTSTAFVKLVGGSLANITAARLVIDSYNSSNIALSQYAVGNFVPTNAALVTQRYSTSSTSSTFSNAATAFVRPYIQFEANSGVAIDITLRIGLPQLELGAFATSVIPTTTAAATRSADVASITGTNFSSWYNQTQGTTYTSAQVGYTVFGFPVVAAMNDGTSANRLESGYTTASIAGFGVVLGGVDQGSVFPATTAVVRNLACAYQSNNGAASVNGGAVLTLGSMSVPAVNQLTLGRTPGAGSVLNGTISRLTYWPVRLGNNVLRQITQ